MYEQIPKWYVLKEIKIHAQNFDNRSRPNSHCNMNMISILGDLYGHFMCMGHNIIKQLHDIVFQRKNL